MDTPSEPTPVAVDWKPLRQALTTEAGLNALINLVIDGKSQLSIVKELQRHPIQQTIHHVDFLLISRDEAITVDVPVLLTGDAEAVTREDGMVDHVLFDLAITAKPADIPNELTVDISEMTLGDTLRVGDLRLPAGVTTDVDPEEAIAIAQITRATIEADEIAEADAELAAEQAEEGAEVAEGEAWRRGGGRRGRRRWWRLATAATAAQTADQAKAPCPRATGDAG